MGSGHKKAHLYVNNSLDFTVNYSTLDQVVSKVKPSHKLSRRSNVATMTEQITSSVAAKIIPRSNVH